MLQPMADVYAMITITPAKDSQEIKRVNTTLRFRNHSHVAFLNLIFIKN